MEISYEGAERAACNMDDSFNSLITIDRWPSDQGPVPLPRSRAVVKLRLLRAQEAGGGSQISFDGRKDES